MSKRIIVIEDDRFICNLVGGCLTGNYNMTYTEYGEDGLALIRKRSYDLVLLDYILPEMDENASTMML